MIKKTNIEFTEACQLVFGLPSPTFSQLQGQFIGGHRQKPTPVDPYGHTVANAALTGDGFRRRHDLGLKYTLCDILRTTCKQECFIEFSSMFNGKIDHATCLSHLL